MNRAIFPHSGRAKIGARAKESADEGGSGEARERLPAHPTILKNPYQFVTVDFIRWWTACQQISQLQITGYRKNKTLQPTCQTREML